MHEDSMSIPCIECERTVDFRDLVSDPLDEHDMVCEWCAKDRRRQAEEMQAYDYEHRMPNYQKHIR